MKKQILKSESLEDTIKIASDFAKTLKGGDVVALYGDLGSGKTTFVQAVAKALGIREQIVSPSFILVRSYEIPKNNTSKSAGRRFIHIDLYRLESADDLRSVDFSEMSSDSGSLVMIEWAQKAKRVLPEKRIDIHIVYKEEGEREIEIERRAHSR
jgi:tRNA threonylcarbamoyladenosine biosynthesis protein TsaE